MNTCKSEKRDVLLLGDDETKTNMEVWIVGHDLFNWRRSETMELNPHQGALNAAQVFTKDVALHSEDTSFPLSLVHELTQKAKKTCIEFLSVPR